MTEQTPGQLLRVLGPAFAVAVGLGSVIGGGILRTPATVLDAVPDTSIALLLWIAVGIHSLIQANVVCEVMTLWPKSGGQMIPAREAFGEPGGLLVGWTDWLSNVASIASLALLGGEFLALIFPDLATNKMVIAVAVLIAVVGLNALGVREGERSQLIGSALKTLFLLGVVALIFVAVPAAAPMAKSDLSAAVTTAPFGFAALVIAYQTIIGAYAGWPNGAYFGGEDVDPGRNIPRAIFTTILTTGLLFILVTFALNHALSLAQLRQSKLPIADALTPLLGPDAVRLVAAGAALIVITCCNAGVMVASRVLYALAEDRLFPSVAGRVNRGGSPWVALAMTFIAALGLVLTGSFETVFVIMAALGIVPTLVVELSLFKLRRDRPDLGRPWRARLYPWLPALAIVLDAGLLSGFVIADPKSGLFIIGAIAIVVPIGLLMSRRPHKIAT
jgi:amino acid transporter